MSTEPKRYSFRTPIHEVAAYSANVPFHMPLTICDHTLISNDVLTPLTETTAPADHAPIPGCGAIYRLIGDGVHTPTFDAAFLASSSSGTYDNTLGVINIITFIYTGAEYCYSINQVS